MKRVLNMLGLAMRAGRLITGEKAVVQAVRAGQAYLVLLDGGASENARKDISSACSYYGVPLMETDRDALGLSVGKAGRMAAAVTDESMANRMIQLKSNQ